VLREAGTAPAVEAVVRRIRTPTRRTRLRELVPAAAAEVHPFGVGQATARAAHAHPLPPGVIRGGITEACNLVCRLSIRHPGLSVKGNPGRSGRAHWGAYPRCEKGTDQPNCQILPDTHGKQGRTAHQHIQPFGRQGFSCLLPFVVLSNIRHRDNVELRPRRICGGCCRPARFPGLACSVVQPWSRQQRCRSAL
jgi:hypothetical protein